MTKQFQSKHFQNHIIYATPDGEGFLIEIYKRGDEHPCKTFRSPFCDSANEAIEEGERAVERGSLPGIFQ